MTLIEAIRHAIDRADGTDCGQEHAQLARWLLELDGWRRHGFRCARCGEPVEEDRRCFAAPECHACLPPPPDLPTVEFP